MNSAGAQAACLFRSPPFDEEAGVAGEGFRGERGGCAPFPEGEPERDLLCHQRQPVHRSPILLQETSSRLTEQGVWLPKQMHRLG